MDTATIKPKPGKILNSIRFLKTMRKDVKNSNFQHEKVNFLYASVLREKILKFRKEKTIAIRNLTQLINNKQQERLNNNNLLIPEKSLIPIGKRKGSYKAIGNNTYQRENNVMLKERTPFIQPNRKQKRSFKHEVKKRLHIERIQKINENERRQEEISRKAKEEKIKNKVYLKPKLDFKATKVFLSEIM